MKKYIVPFLFVFLLSFFVVGFGFKNKKAVASCYKVYVTSLDEVDYDLSCCKVIDLGFCYEISSEGEVKTKGTGSKLGQSKIFYCTKESINKIFSNIGFCVSKKYQLNEVLIFEGKDANGQRMQGAFSNGKLTIGSPVIFGSY